MYIYENENWTNFIWDNEEILKLLSNVRYKQGLLLGKMKQLGFNFRMETSLEALTLNIIKSSEIEGENLENNEVRSSLARRLNIDVAGFTKKIDKKIISSKEVDGFVNVIIDATQNYTQKLTKERLFLWHKQLFPYDDKEQKQMLHKINRGVWRNDSQGRMQVISGAIGKEKIHFEAIKAENIESEMQKFISWFNQEDDLDPIIKAGIAHFYFITLHPFDDGNGRIARIITDLLLAKSDNCKERFYSMSSAIERNRKEYYTILERSQKGTNDISLWLCWFLNCLENALNQAENLLEKTLLSVKVFERLNKNKKNSRQEKVLKRLLEDFEGNLTTSKYAKLAKCSQDTALRDITNLIELKILKKSEKSGRSTHYELCLLP